MSYLKNYTYLNYLFEPKFVEEDRKPSHFYLFNPNADPDVHRVGIGCLEQGGLVDKLPCNILSGDFHGQDKDYFFERSDAQLGCSKTDTYTGIDATGGLTSDVGFLTDGSIYSDLGVTIGKAGEPTSTGHLYINKVDNDLVIPNKIIGQPRHLSNSNTQNPLQFISDSASNSNGVSLNNGSQIIDEDGLLNTTVHIFGGNLYLDDWDLYADVEPQQADEPCNPNSTTDTYEHECAICEARADSAEASITDRVGDCYECAKYYITTDENDNDEYAVYDHCADADTDSPCHVSHPCGSVWEDTSNGGWYSASDGKDLCLQLIHMDLDGTKSVSWNLDKYRTLCYDDCNEGTTNFEMGHPSFASCKDPNYDADGGRLPDVWHACGKDQVNSPWKKVKIPLNRSS